MLYQQELNEEATIVGMENVREKEYYMFSLSSGVLHKPYGYNQNFIGFR